MSMGKLPLMFTLLESHVSREAFLPRTQAARKGPIL
jgi:hypothetical protein